mmetsp:Transcript_103984/g.291308  ORF Transcript_103984/g.291308 Transcript_103984/m.291308 type:complete len:206 (+) Transcript_103984:206-823(+)
MVGTRTVISQHFGSVFSHKQTTIIGTGLSYCLSIYGLNLQVFGSNVVRDFDTFFNRLAFYCKTLFQGFQSCRTIGLWQCFNLLCDFLIDFFNHSGICTQENGPGYDIVFGLCNQISSHNLGIGCFITNDQDFRRSRQHVNAALSIDQGFRGSHPFVAGSTNDITSRDHPIDTKRHGSNGLGTTNAQKQIYVGNVSCCHGNRSRSR